MKIIKILTGVITTSFILFYFPNVIGQTNTIKNDLKDLNLNGKVSTLVETSYYAKDKDGEIKKVSGLNENSYSFNEKGNEIIVKTYGSDLNLIYKTLYKYDDKGNKILNNSFNSGDTLLEKAFYKYDDKGNITEMSRYDAKGGSEGKWSYKYNDQDIRLRRIVITPTAVLMKKLLISTMLKGIW